MKYYEENSAAMSEAMSDDDNVDIESDVSDFLPRIQIFTNSRDSKPFLFVNICDFRRTETI